MDLQKMIMDGVQDKIVAEISKKTGLSGDVAQKTIKAALPMLMGSLSKNADSAEWKEAINTALDSHDEVYKLDENQGSKILKHILWKEETKVEENIATQAGVSKKEATGVTKLLAPFLMSQLGAAKKSGTDVAGALQKDSLMKSLLTGFLDKDKDGDIKDDLLTMAMNYMKKKFMK